MSVCDVNFSYENWTSDRILFDGPVEDEENQGTTAILIALDEQAEMMPKLLLGERITCVLQDLYVYWKSGTVIVGGPGPWTCQVKDAGEHTKALALKVDDALRNGSTPVFTIADLNEVPQEWNSRQPRAFRFNLHVGVNIRSLRSLLADRCQVEDSVPLGMVSCLWQSGG
ncbi:MAG: hypothetical protein KDK78_00885 [Chlamydiia bacterium]|nr:hypothetical protein [Chlamydiia bacterium]